MSPVTSPSERLRALLAGARALVDPSTSLGVRARRELPASTGLSPEGVELALRSCLEHSPGADEVAALLASVTPSRRAHVLLPGNVFVAAHRAIALALATGGEVQVRASRREPVMARLLCEASGQLFRIVETLSPEPGDQLWAYGSDATLDELGASLRSGVRVHAGGHGYGVVVVEGDVVPAGAPSAERRAGICRGIARDVALFEQRGCLSPRIVLCRGSVEWVRELAVELSIALAAEERRIPLGRLGDDELAERRRYEQSVRYLGELLPAGSGVVGLVVEGDAVLCPPAGRHLHVARVASLRASLGHIAHEIVSVGVAGGEALRVELASLLPAARLAEPGQMQRPPFDGPVDRRPPREQARR